jgi:uroporphyrinogen decarboxylase
MKKIGDIKKDDLMRELDVEQFWKDDEIAHRDNCFYRGPQVALGLRMSPVCVFSELGEEGEPWMPWPPKRQLELNKRYNDKAEKIVGRRVLSEDILPDECALPPMKRVGEVFECKYEFHKGSEWLIQSVNTSKELEMLLDRVEKLDLREFMLPSNWESEKKRIFETYGVKPQQLRAVRGPITLATSIMGVENLIFLILDERDLAKRFSDTIAEVLIGMAHVIDEEAGVARGEKPGYRLLDDNCYTLNEEMYEFFGYPILEKVFNEFSPAQGDFRHQHSDSDMGHLLPILSRLDFTEVNFGPNVLIPEIRKYIPEARVIGCLSPFSLMSNRHEEVLEQTLHDVRDGLVYGGVDIQAAGSINDGTSLETMRLIMAVIQKYGRR